MTDRTHRDAQHQTLREMLGSYALGHLSAAERDMVRAHLDGCAECRAELDDIADLAPLLTRIDPVRYNTVPRPHPGLSHQIREGLVEETRARETQALTRLRAARQTRRTRRVRLGVIAAALALITGIGGVAIGRSTAPEPAAIPKEQIELTAAANSEVQIDDAFLVPHTWGVELRIAASGFDDGAAYQAAFRSETGEMTPAGEFLGTGADPMTCNLQSAILRDDVTSVVITDATGRVVLTSPL